MQQFTIAQNAETVIEEKRSKFMAFAFYVTSEEEVNKILATLRKKYADARHICYAYNIGVGEMKNRSSDDAEPAGSAGVPMQNVIQKAKLTNVLCVVVRYFGGVLLGKALLTRTYAKSTKEVLDLADRTVLCEAIYCREHQLYSDFERLGREIELFGAWDLKRNFDTDVIVDFFIKASDRERFEQLTMGRQIEYLKTEWIRMSKDEKR